MVEMCSRPIFFSFIRYLVQGCRSLILPHHRVGKQEITNSKGPHYLFELDDISFRFFRSSQIQSNARIVDFRTDMIALTSNLAIAKY